MVLKHFLAAGAVLAATASMASATDPVVNLSRHLPQVPTGYKLDKHNQIVKIYPKYEYFYIRQYPQPRINCDACFGYYKPQWRSWPEACGEPEDYGPPSIVHGGVMPVPPVDGKDMKPVEPGTVPSVKPADVKPMLPDATPLPKPAEIKPADVKPVVPAPIEPKPMVPMPVPVPMPVEPKKAGEGKSTALPVVPPVESPIVVPVAPAPLPTPKVVQATPVSLPGSHLNSAPVVPLLPTLPVVNVK